VVHAGEVFLTGHDPDFHSQPGLGNGDNLLAKALAFVTGGTFNDGLAPTKFLWVESNIAAPSGHVKGYNSLDDVGATLGLDYDIVDAAGFATVNLANYNAIAVASSFGGTLTRAELDALIARKADIANFINAGGGLFASAECFPCGANLLGSADGLFGFLPVVVTSIGANPPSRPRPLVRRWVSLSPISTTRPTIPSASSAVSTWSTRTLPATQLPSPESCESTAESSLRAFLSPRRTPCCLPVSRLSEWYRGDVVSTPPDQGRECGAARGRRVDRCA
jgi:hypothetical protein